MFNKLLLCMFVMTCASHSSLFSQVESLLDHDRLGFYEGLTLKSFLTYTGTHLTLENNETNGDIYVDARDDLYFQAGSTTRMFINELGNIGIGTTGPTYKLDAIGNRIRLRSSTASTARSIMLRTDGAAVDLQAEGADLFLRSIGNDININPFVNDGRVWVNGQEMSSGASTEEFNVVTSDMNLEDVDPYLRLVETPGGFDLAGINFKDGPTSRYWLNYNFATNQFFLGDSFTVGTADFIVDGTTGDVTVSNDINANGDIDVGGRVLFGSVEYIEDGGLNEIAARGDIRPTSNNIYDLGTSTFRWDDVYATNGTIQTSDKTLKKNIENISYGLDEVLKMRPVQYQWNSGNDQESVKLGLIAQEVLKITPEVVKEYDFQLDDNEKLVKQKNELLGMNYSELIPVLIKAIQEQDQRIKELEAKLK